VTSMVYVKAKVKIIDNSTGRELPVNVLSDPINVSNAYALFFLHQSTGDQAPECMYIWDDASGNGNSAVLFTASQSGCPSVSSNGVTLTNTYGYISTNNLLNSIVSVNKAITIIVKFYYTGSPGIIMGFSNNGIGSSPSSYTPLIYVGTNGYLYVGDYASAFVQVSTPLSQGWHTLVFEEYYSNGTYYVSLWLDGSFINTASTTNTPQLFSSGTTTYWTFNTGYANSWTNAPSSWSATNYTYAYIYVYNTALPSSTAQSASSGSIPSGYVIAYTVNSWNSYNSTICCPISINPNQSGCNASICLYSPSSSSPVASITVDPYKNSTVSGNSFTLSVSYTPSSSVTVNQVGLCYAGYLTYYATISSVTLNANTAYTIEFTLTVS